MSHYSNKYEHKSDETVRFIGSVHVDKRAESKFFKHWASVGRRKILGSKFWNCSANGTNVIL